MEALALCVRGSGITRMHLQEKSAFPGRPVSLDHDQYAVKLRERLRTQIAARKGENQVCSRSCCVLRRGIVDLTPAERQKLNFGVRGHIVRNSAHSQFERGFVDTKGRRPR